MKKVEELNLEELLELANGSGYFGHEHIQRTLVLIYTAILNLNARIDGLQTKRIGD